MSFNGRELQTKITAEFIEHAVDAPKEHVVDQIRGEVRKIEDTYAAVTMVEKVPNGYGDPHYQLIAIPKRNSDVEMVNRALQEVTSAVMRHFDE
ncbi:hypothetical protein OSG_eHP34_00250 [environmental Halophage eHP-34]|nr:hypothetical protein OSG_eHP34_00250 [environmental Halophage eHP-34]